MVKNKHGYSKKAKKEKLFSVPAPVYMIIVFQCLMLKAVKYVPLNHLNAFMIFWLIVGILLIIQLVNDEIYEINYRCDHHLF